jgi:anaerobic ribonucleoside-triphosphate reductase activating protein
MKVFLSRAHFPITTLGFGRRIGIWFQGCSIRCAGCISADTWPTDRGETTVDLLAKILEPWLMTADGVTVSGGEPFDQPEPLAAILRIVRQRAQGDVLVYSGYAWESLEPTFDHFRDLIDVLISDPFDRAAGQTRPLRGSDNQRMHLLSKLGRDRYGALRDARMDPRGRALDIFIDESGDAWFAGIPSIGDMPRLKELIEAQGFSAAITQASERQ